MNRPILTLKTKHGLIQPTGRFSSIFTTAELKYALQLGYDIKVTKCILFRSRKQLFDTYVDDMYSKKADPNITAASRFIYKLLLNTLYGVMGASQDKRETTVLKNDCDELATLLANKTIVSQHNLRDFVVIQYLNDYDVSDSGFKYLNRITNYNSNFSNVLLAMQITANARIYMHKLIQRCLKNNINVYYTDTDSIFIDQKLPDSYIGSGLGYLKQEYSLIEEAYFLGPKVYGLKLINGDEVVKFKGITPKTVNFEFIKNLYYSREPVSIDQTRFVGGNKFSGIKTKNTTMNYSGVFYNKGELVYDANGMWVGTLPFHLK